MSRRGYKGLLVQTAILSCLLLSSGSLSFADCPLPEPAPLEQVPCVECHQGVTQGVESLPVPSEPGNLGVKFSHKPHEKIDCLTCHNNLSGAAGDVRVEECFGCHEERIAKGKCRDCHGKDRFFPSYHQPAGKWMRRHGLRANTMVMPDRRAWNRVKPGHVYNCSACHVDDQCRKCHQLNRPESHTGFWRIRGHGIRALAERQSCASCHVETFCVRCHKTTKPINHRANWNMLHGKAVARGQAERCWVCHPTVITRIHVGDTPECLFCHPR